MRRMLWWGARGMVILALLPVGLGAALFRRTDGHPTVSRAEHRVGVSETDLVPRIDSVAGAALRVAPFRPDGRPSREVYDPNRTTQAPENAGMARPMLVVTGIMEGRAPLAVIEGVPGREGAVVMAVGDTAGGVRLRRIKGGTVTITGMDTTWTLTVRGAP